MNVKITKDPIKPETPEILAASLIKIADSFEKIMSFKDGLTEEAVIVLLFGMKGNNVSKGDIRLVLKNLSRLKSYYVRKSAK